MKICLKTYSKESNSQNVNVTLSDRLPEFISTPPELSCNFSVAKSDDYYLFSYSVRGKLEINCQRCLDKFEYDYHHESKLAICISEESAEKLMQHIEAIVMTDHQVDLCDILVDDLHLFVPEKHDSIADCSDETSHWIRSEHENIALTLGLQEKTL